MRRGLIDLPQNGRCPLVALGEVVADSIVVDFVAVAVVCAEMTKDLDSK